MNELNINDLLRYNLKTLTRKYAKPDQGTVILNTTGEIVHGVDPVSVDTDLKVNVRAGGITGSASISDRIPLIYVLPHVHVKR